MIMQNNLITCRKSCSHSISVHGEHNVKLMTRGPYYATKGELITLHCDIHTRGFNILNKGGTLGWEKHTAQYESVILHINLEGSVSTTYHYFVNATLFNLFLNATKNNEGDYRCFYSYELVNAKSNLTSLILQGKFSLHSLRCHSISLNRK